MMRFRLLGPLEIRAGEDDWRGIGAPKWRSVLAALLINAGQIVPADVLINEVWGETQPAKAGNLISIYVLRLRRLLGDTDSTVLVTRAPGYQLRLGPGDTDAQLFEDLVRQGRRAYAAGDPERTAAQLAEALALWHGSPLADVPPTPLIETEAERLADLRLDCAELRITAELACGSHAQVIPELRRLLADHSLRENLWLLLMRALDGAGRHAEALEAYGQARGVLAEELGVDPGAELRQCYADLLAKDDALTKDAGDAPGSISGGIVAAGSGPASSAAAEPRVARPAPAPAQLPADVTDFTGREDQVKHLCDLLASGGAEADPGAVRIALVAGSGGLGKTSLAVHAAHRVGGSFSDGQLYVDLLGAGPQPLPPADVLARFLRDLGVDGRDIPA
ncbi:MAG: BTAD domain-containing putative transcriptional regulator, partial [Streptosporangiaceae bacterium]